MARDNENGAVVTPLLGAGALGTGAYGSYALDNYLASVGLRKGLTLNPEAIERINAFANLKPGISRNPNYLYDYADLGNKASRVQLFNEDPRKAYEWFSESEPLRKSLTKNLKSFERFLNKTRQNLYDYSYRRLPRFIGKKRAKQVAEILANTKLQKLHENLLDTIDIVRPLRNKISIKRTAAKKLHEAMAFAHETEIGKSRTRALLRLMHEWADVAPFNARATNANTFVRELANSLMNWRTSVNPKTGLPYRSAAEHFTKNFKDSTVESMEPFMKFFSDLDKAKQKLSKKELVREIKKRMFPATFVNGEGMDSIKLKGTKPFEKEVLKQLGRTAKYEYVPELNKIVQSGKYSRKPGIKGVESIKSIIRKSPALSFIASDLTYTGSEFGRMLKVLRVAQAIRNPKLRWALGLGATGLGGLGVSNLIKRFSSKKSDR